MSARTSTSSTQILASKYQLSDGKKQDAFDKWLGKYKVNLDHLVVSESIRKYSKMGT